MMRVFLGILRVANTPHRWIDDCRRSIIDPYDSIGYSEEMQRLEGIFAAWGRILTGYAPALSIELTRECPLRCPGCYAYGDDHLGGGMTLRGLTDRTGQDLIDGVLECVDRL